MPFSSLGPKSAQSVGVLALGGTIHFSQNRPINAFRVWALVVMRPELRILVD
jgi:hypothetical protein